MAARAGERPSEPERAGEEGAFGAGQAVLAAVAEDERPVPQVAAHGVHGAPHALVLGRGVAEQGAQQDSGVELVGSRRPHVGPHGVGPGPVLDEGPYGGCMIAPPLRLAAGEEPSLGEVGRPVQGDGAQHLRLGEVDRRAAHLPDPRVGTRPDPGDEVGGFGEAPGHVPIEGTSGLCIQPRRLEQVAVHVQLELVERAIAHPDRM